jgi:hypothetical protein
MKPQPNAPARRVLVAGAGGALLHALRHCGPGDQVTVLTTGDMEGMPRQTRCAVVAKERPWADPLPAADHAVVQIGAVRRAREAVFWQPSRADLWPLAEGLRERGVHTLEVWLADGSALGAPERRRLLALGFEQVTEHQPGGPAPARVTSTWPERLAAWMIATVWGTMQQVTASLHRRSAPRVSRAPRR